MSNNGIPPLNDWQDDNYPVIYDEGNSKSYYVKTGNKVEITGGGSSSYLVSSITLTDTQIIALNNTKYTIVTAPGIGKFIYPICAALNLTWSNDYSGIEVGSILSIDHGDSGNSFLGVLDNSSGGVNGLLANGDNVIALLPQGTFVGSGILIGSSGWANASLENLPLKLSLFGQTNPLGGGNESNILKVMVYYVIYDL